MSGGVGGSVHEQQDQGEMALIPNGRIPKGGLDEPGVGVSVTRGRCYQATKLVSDLGSDPTNHSPSGGREVL